jgi:hypothetical protein
MACSRGHYCVRRRDPPGGIDGQGADPTSSAITSSAITSSAVTSAVITNLRHHLLPTKLLDHTPSASTEYAPYQRLQASRRERAH